MEDIRTMLNRVASGELSVDQAVLELKKEPFSEAGFDELGFAKLDTHRRLRQGIAEVIYGAGKTAEQIAGIVEAMKKRGQELVLITRMDPEKARHTEDLLKQKFEDGAGFRYFDGTGIGICGDFPEKDGVGTIVVATGGTSDIPVAEEAALTAEALGNQVERLYDVGVAGLHRLVAHMDTIMSARVIIAIAGMEGALASVIGGLADCPVIAVPTSIGYGASFHGVSALLSMLNSCASGVSVVNIDNGYGGSTGIYDHAPWDGLLSGSIADECRNISASEMYPQAEKYEYRSGRRRRFCTGCEGLQAGSGADHGGH